MKELELIEQLLNLPPLHLKIGLINGEFEMNLRLKEALQVCKERVFFVSSGFLDKFGSDLEATLQSGAVGSYRQLNQTSIKIQYEKNNALIARQAKIAQVGAGMWPKTKDQAGHLKSKNEQIQAGNDVSWNPDPRFSVLHALCYHRNTWVPHIKQYCDITVCSEDLYMPPLGNFTDPKQPNYISQKDIQESLREATFGLIGYATPWITKGIGCSAINSIEGEPLMEDRATARIKVAFLRNWLVHDIITKKQFMAMIEEVSQQIPDVTNEVKNAVTTLVCNPDQNPTALVEDIFMEGYDRQQEKKQNAAGLISNKK